MPATTTEIRLSPRLITAAPLALLLLTACGSTPPPGARPQSRSDDCLREVKVEDLAGALRRCDDVVRAFPEDPRPLSERFVLHTLNGDQAAACSDIEQAALLLAAGRGAPAEEQLITDIRVRQESCREKPPLPTP
jgi:hypothetical protein